MAPQTTARTRRADAPTTTILPSQDPELLGELQAAIDGGNARLTDGRGHETAIPEELYEVLADVISAMQAGRAVVLTPVSLRMTTGEAADFLGVSRPTVVKLLEDGHIPFDKPNRHRYVRFEDLRQYQERQHHTATKALASMMEEANEDGLYDVTPRDYEHATMEARRSGGH